MPALCRLPVLLLAALLSAQCTSAPTPQKTLLLAPTTNPTTAAAKPTGPTKYEDTIKRFEALDQRTPPPANPTLFVGSSSFTRWKNLETEFREFRPLNRGFGGSTFPDLLYYFDRIVLPYKPAKIVVYEGTNDIAIHRTPEQVVGDVKTLAALVRKNLPETHLYILSLNPAPIRAAMSAQMDAANTLIQDFVRSDPHLHYIDARQLLTDAQGNPDPQYYAADHLHPNDKGYARWIPTLKSALQSPAQGPKN